MNEVTQERTGPRQGCIGFIVDLVLRILGQLHRIGIFERVDDVVCRRFAREGLLMPLRLVEQREQNIGINSCARRELFFDKSIRLFHKLFPHLGADLVLLPFGFAQ